MTIERIFHKPLWRAFMSEALLQINQLGLDGYELVKIELRFNLFRPYLALRYKNR